MVYLSIRSLLPTSLTHVTTKADETVKLDISSQTVQIAKEIADADIFIGYDDRQEIYIEDRRSVDFNEYTLRVIVWTVLQLALLAQDDCNYFLHLIEDLLVLI